MSFFIESVTALIAGILSFFSPCIFPLIPAYISIISGVSFENACDIKADCRRVKTASILFVLGFSLVFSILGASTTLAGKFLFKNRELLSIICGVLIIIFSFHLAGIFNLKFLNRQKSFGLANFKVGLLGSFAMGAAFGLGWIPCIGPVLAGFLTLAAVKETVYKGILLLFFYSMGLGIPFLLTGFFVDKAYPFFLKYKKIVQYSKFLAAGLLFIIGLILIFQPNFSYFKL